jgi:hypothetical protein
MDSIGKPRRPPWACPMGESDLLRSPRRIPSANLFPLSSTQAASGRPFDGHSAPSNRLMRGSRRQHWGTWSCEGRNPFTGDLQSCYTLRRRPRYDSAVYRKAQASSKRGTQSWQVIHRLGNIAGLRSTAPSNGWREACRLRGSPAFA